MRTISVLASIVAIGIMVLLIQSGKSVRSVEPSAEETEFLYGVDYVAEFPEGVDFYLTTDDLQEPVSVARLERGGEVIVNPVWTAWYMNNELGGEVRPDEVKVLVDDGSERVQVWPK